MKEGGEDKEKVRRGRQQMKGANSFLRYD